MIEWVLVYYAGGLASVLAGRYLMPEKYAEMHQGKERLYILSLFSTGILIGIGLNLTMINNPEMSSGDLQTLATVLVFTSLILIALMFRIIRWRIHRE